LSPGFISDKEKYKFQSKKEKSPLFDEYQLIVGKRKLCVGEKSIKNGCQIKKAAQMNSLVFYYISKPYKFI
jgi:hypothetical protein